MRASVLICALLSVAAVANAQGTTISVRGMIVSADPATRGAVGAGATVELSRRVAVATEIDYFTISDWASTLTSTAILAVAFGADGWEQRAVPYVFGGGGVQRARISLGSSRVFGTIPDAIDTGAQFCAARGTGPGSAPIVAIAPGCESGASAGWGIGDLPEFYGRRLEIVFVPGDRVWPDKVFFDPVMTAGGGVRMQAGENWVIGPEARIWIVFAEGQRRVSGLFGATLGYRF